MLKHAPGLRAAGSIDTHEKTPTQSIEETTFTMFTETHLRPFIEITQYIESLGKTPMVMYCHMIYDCLDPDWSVTFSKESLMFLKQH